jgi:hypothetical protein
MLHAHFVVIGRPQQMWNAIGWREEWWGFLAPARRRLVDVAGRWSPEDPALGEGLALWFPLLKLNLASFAQPNVPAPSDGSLLLLRSHGDVVASKESVTCGGSFGVTVLYGV